MDPEPSSLFERVKTTLPFLSRNRNYQKLSQEEEGRVALASDSPIRTDYRDDANAEEEAISLLDTQVRRKPTRRTAPSCVCCGLNCGLFWKVIGILAGLSVIFYSIKFVIWMVKPSPTGLENMPVYGESLGCGDAPYIYNSSAFSVYAPMGSLNNNHMMDIKGMGVGTVSIAAARGDATEIEYEMTIRTNKESLLKDVRITQPHVNNEDGSARESRLRLLTPNVPASEAADACVRYDVVLYVPRTLKKLHVQSHAKKTHVRFDAGSDVDIESSLFVTLFGSSSENMILPNEHIRATKMGLEVFNGWIVGDVQVQDETKIKTQRGHGVTNIKVHPTGVPTDDPSVVYTVTGGGRTDISYLAGPDNLHRPMRSAHISADPKSEMYLTYSSSGFKGRIELDAKNYSARNIQSLGSQDPVPGKTKDTVKEQQWTHYVGSSDGPDEIRVDTRGWAGLYL